MEFRSRIDPAEEARHREVMDGMGVYDARWALYKVLEQSDVQKGQNRLLLTKDTVRAGPIPKVFPELEELGEDGRNAERKVDVTVLDADGRQNSVHLRYLNSNKAYRVTGAEWRLFVDGSELSRGDRLDLYTCRRGDDRCLFFFKTKGWDAIASGGSAAWCTNGRKRVRQPATAVVRDDDGEEFLLLSGGRADGGNGNHYGDVDYTPARRDRRRERRRRAKNDSRRVRGEDRMVFVTNDGVHAWSGGGFQGGYGCYKKAERRRGDEESLDLNATPDEREAAKGLLMLKYAICADRRC